MENWVLGDRFQVERTLAKRPEGVALLARDLQTQAQVIAKLRVAKDELSQEAIKLLAREAEILRLLSHPAIPKYIDHFEITLRQGPALVLVQSYIPGQSIARLLNQGKTLTEAEAIQVGLNILEILQYLHGRTPPILHRDIQPRNILLTYQADSSFDHAYLTGFGSVQNFAANTAGSFTMVGTYGYMSPEQAGGRAVKSSDLYSLGATLIHGLTGVEPASLQSKSLRIEFESHHTISPRFGEWLKAITEPNVGKRPDSAQKALGDLRRVQAEAAMLADVVKPQVTLDRQPGSLKITIPENLGYLILFIDRHHYQMTHQVLGVAIPNKKMGQRSAIKQVLLSDTELRLQIGSQQHKIGDNRKLKLAELRWLAEELSQWLSLPLSQV